MQYMELSRPLHIPEQISAFVGSAMLALQRQSISRIAIVTSAFGGLRLVLADGRLAKRDLFGLSFELRFEWPIVLAWR